MLTSRDTRSQIGFVELRVREEDLDQAGLGVVVDGGLGDPDVIIGERWTGGDFQEVEVGIKDAMG